MTRPRILAPLVGALLALSGCGGGITSGLGKRDGGGGGNPDLTGGGGGNNDGGGGADLTNPNTPNACGDFDPTCTVVTVGPSNMGGMPFPLPTDPKPNPGVSSSGLGRDMQGHLVLDQTNAVFDFLWIANSNDVQGKGTVSKLDSKKIKEVARYFTVTCNSHSTGNRNSCDGVMGCCAMDSYPQFQKRQAGQASGPHQQVNTGNNSPSRTAVDYNGDMWVANRAFGGQSSVTKIANDTKDCVDRNKNGKIDTSSDVNNDGQIVTDCNADGQADDIAGVLGKACTNGMPQEFYGLDDECVIMTVNTNVPNQYGRPLALGRGSVDFGPSDAWAGTYNDGKFFRIDGKTGLTKSMAQLPNACRPYGATVDSQGILWAPNLGTGLCYFDTDNPTFVGQARSPSGFSHQAYGVTLDRDQNVWTGGLGTGAFRYSPDRSQGFTKLGMGWWTLFQNPGSSVGATGSIRGIAADSRSQNEYFVWGAKDGGWVVRIDASAHKPLVGQDTTVNATTMPAAKIAGSSTIGVGVDRDQNVWGVSYSGSVATRVMVDQTGKITAPDITGIPAPGAKCPAGDRCLLKDGSTEPAPYTYSDFTGFGLRNFTNPKGNYSMKIKGCEAKDTRWLKIVWQSTVPPNTKITVKARAGKNATVDGTWGSWTPDATASPLDLLNGGLVPNVMDANYLEVEFNLSTMDKNASPKLIGFQVLYECQGGIG